MTLGFFDWRKVKEESQNMFHCTRIYQNQHFPSPGFKEVILWDITGFMSLGHFDIYCLLSMGYSTHYSYSYSYVSPLNLSIPLSPVAAFRSVALQLNLTYLFIDPVCRTEQFEVAFRLTIDYPRPPPTLLLLPCQLLHTRTWQAHLPSFRHSALLPFTLPVLSAWLRRWKGGTMRRPIRWVNTHSPSLW